MSEQQTPEAKPSSQIEARFEKRKWKDRTKSQKITFILSIVIMVLSIALLLIFAFSRQIFGDKVGDALLGEDVPNGFIYLWRGVKNKALAIFGTLLTIVSCFVFFFVCNFLIRLFTGSTNKSKTIGSLIRSCVKYLTILVGFAVILTLWGVNVASVVAGLGILTLIIGLGCQTLIQDIVSGVFIVFDDYFSVGDLVIIDGFRGTVSSIGLKTTKLTDAGGNIKAITNSSITTVTNVSRLPTMVTITISIDYSESIERVEGILGAHLEEITKGIPQITEGIYYKGVDSLNEAGIGLLFLAYCLEGNRFQVARDMRRDIYLLLKNNNVIIPFNQITVNTPSPVPPVTASPSQVEESQRLTVKNRAVPKPKKIRKTIRQRAQEALTAEVEEIKK